ncbi:MAG TPA: hypothetical protein VNG94_05165, partial [Pyrinomonadaceae bacterium]|nr:hypothetical protein [Pyrinomonadaceae bacterium]
MVALELEERQGDRVDVSRGDGEGGRAQGIGNRSRISSRWERGERRVVDLRARGKSTALAGALVVDEKVAQFL